MGVGVAHRVRFACDPIRCAFDERQILSRFFPCDDTDPRRAFERWATTFCDALRRKHPLSKSYQVADLIRHHFSETLDFSGLARRLKMTPSGLRRAFRAEFGRTPHEYQAALRLIASVDKLASMKVDAVAIEVGYKSKKNFYRMFKSLTSFTPARFRRLSAFEQRRVIAAPWRRFQG